MDYIQVFTTVDNKEAAERIAKSIVEKRLAACVQIVGPIESVYRWKGKIEKAVEWLLLIKSKKSLYAELEKSIREMHPYEVPEIISVPISQGFKDYLNWLETEVK